MASPAVVNFEQLLAPIRGENPAGEDLRRDFSAKSLYRMVRDARTKAREAERRSVFEETDGSRGSQADWKPVLELGTKAIAERSKDLEITALVTEALVRQHGFAGLRDGFRLVRELVQRFWDHLYPAFDEDGVKTRVAPLAGLNGEEGEGLLSSPISRVPITAGRTTGPFALADYRQAIELDGIQDPDKRARRLEQPGVVSMQTFNRAVSESPPEFFRNLLDDISECAQEFDQLCGLLEEKCGADQDGSPLAPSSSNIRNALETCREDVAAIARPVLGGGAEGGQQGGSAAGRGAGLGRTTGEVRGREEAFQALLRVAEFFKRTEPHSPVSYALEQAVRWGRMALPELLSELIPEETFRQDLFKRLGIVDPREKRE